MSLKNIISIGDYTPPAPSSFKTSSPDKVKDYEMENGDTVRFLIRTGVMQFDMTFEMTKAQRDTFIQLARSGGEIDITYDGNIYHTFVTAYSENVKNVRRKGNYAISVSFKECRR